MKLEKKRVELRRVKTIMARFIGSTKDCFYKIANQVAISKIILQNAENLTTNDT
jgi:hypothetical protein